MIHSPRTFFPNPLNDLTFNLTAFNSSQNLINNAISTLKENPIELDEFLFNSNFPSSAIYFNGIELTQEQIDEIRKEFI